MLQQCSTHRLRPDPGARNLTISAGRTAAQVAAEGLLQGDVVSALARTLSSQSMAEAGLGASGQPQFRMPDISVGARCIPGPLLIFLVE